MAGGKMLVQIVKQLTEAQALPAAGYRAQDMLRLTAVAMGRDDQAAGDDVGGFAAEIFTHQMQTKVDPRRAAGGSHQQSIAHVKDVLHHLDLRKTGLQRRGVAPVGCRLAAIEQPGGGENEHPGTDRNNPTSAGVGGSQRGAQRLGDRGVDAAPAGITIVSAWARSSGPPSVIRRMPPVAHSGPSSTAATANWYQLSPISGRGRPKISTATPNSKVHRPS